MSIFFYEIRIFYEFFTDDTSQAVYFNIYSASIERANGLYGGFSSHTEARRHGDTECVKKVGRRATGRIAPFAVTAVGCGLFSLRQ